MTSRVIYLVATLTCANAAHDGGHCPCKFQRWVGTDASVPHAAQLPASLYENFPSSNPGKYKNMAAIKIYGTTCAAWDHVPDTPWYSYCPIGSNWWHNDYNWCMQPWCYVDKNCTGDKTATSVFAGSDVAFYSYRSCANKGNCYTGIAWNKSYLWPPGCPHNPHGGLNYAVHKTSNDCACTFYGKQLNSEFYNDFPVKDPPGCTPPGSSGGVACKKYPGMYKNMSAIKYYGTTCAAWDQMPETPWFSYCPSGSDWCHYDYNWCQQPWCYVDAKCTSKVATSVFQGSTVAYYSYDTCLSTPDCYTNIAWEPAATRQMPAGDVCPYDHKDSHWYTSKECEYWTGEEVVDASSYARMAHLAGGALALMVAMFAL